MKKIFLAIAFFTAIFSTANAQTKKAAAPAPVQKTVKAAPAKASGLKADGTPDMRLKANQAAAKKAPAAGPKKADGTPDMRFKANQPAKKAVVVKKP